MVCGPKDGFGATKSRKKRPTERRVGKGPYQQDLVVPP